VQLRTEDQSIDEQTKMLENAQNFRWRIFITSPKRAESLAENANCQKMLNHFQYIVIDEADAVLEPLSKYATQREKSQRMRHPKPGNSIQ
jgi:superfamily II DNA/RNA helicase